MDEHHVAQQNPWVVGIRFRQAGQIYDFDPGPLILVRDDRVLVETEHGPALATVAVPPRRRHVDRPLKRVVKKADARDLAREDRGLQRQREYSQAALAVLRTTSLPAKLVKVESALDGGRATFFLSVEERVDTRELARDIADRLHVRVELRQIGARDAAKVAGGVGVCGRELCCSSWLREFQAVTVKMVKEQGLSLSPSKLAGQCGRLKCCLRYEYATYQELRRALPNVGTTVESVKGNGRIARHNVLRQTVVIRRDDDGLEVEATLDDLVVRRAAD